MFIATDANPDALSETAARASRKPSRGGRSNLICIAEPLEVIARELPAAADRVTVILPWGSLLRGLVQPEDTSLTQLHSLCAPHACVEIVFSYDYKRDASERAPLGLMNIHETHVQRVLPEVYERMGLGVTSVERISQHELGRYETTWAKRLAFGRQREIWGLRAVAQRPYSLTIENDPSSDISDFCSLVRMNSPIRVMERK